MRAERMTNKCQMALADAQSKALGMDHQFIEPAHVLTSMLDQDGSAVRPLLTAAGADVPQLRSQLGQALDRIARVEGVGGNVHPSNDLVRVLNLADKLAQKRDDEYISSELFVVAALQDGGELGRIIAAAGVTEQRLLDTIEAVRGGEAVNDPNAEENRRALEKFTIDLTERAEQGKLDPVIGRDEEIRRTDRGDGGGQRYRRALRCRPHAACRFPIGQSVRRTISGGSAEGSPRTGISTAGDGGQPAHDGAGTFQMERG